MEQNARARLFAVRAVSRVKARSLNGRRRPSAAVEAARGVDRGSDARGEPFLAGPRRVGRIGGVLRRFGRAVARWRADLQAALSALLRVSSVRYSLLGLAAVAVIIAATIQLASVIVDHWSDATSNCEPAWCSARSTIASWRGLRRRPPRDLGPFFESPGKTSG